MKKYYSLKKILAENADYNIIIGERSNGKTYSVLEKILTDYVNEKKEGAYIRRWRDDITGKRGDSIFNAMVRNGVVEKITKGEWNNIIYSKNAWHLARYNPDTLKMVAEKNAFCHAFALSDVEHDKSTSYPNICNIVFDEFLTRRYYLPDEFILFMNVLSTIIRDRDNIKIFMLGNTVNKYCPYFAELGLSNIDGMVQGDIDLYQFNNQLKIAVEYCNESKATKKSNKYFSFDNPRLNMITKGKWEVAIYPHLTAGYKIKQKNILFRFTIIFNNKKVLGEIVCQDNGYFIYIHNRTTDIKENELVYSPDFTVSPYRRKTFLNSRDNIDVRIKTLFATDRVFYQSNDIGELVHNYLLNVNKI